MCIKGAWKRRSAVFLKHRKGRLTYRKINKKELNHILVKAEISKSGYLHFICVIICISSFIWPNIQNKTETSWLDLNWKDVDTNCNCYWFSWSNTNCLILFVFTECTTKTVTLYQWRWLYVCHLSSE